MVDIVLDTNVLISALRSKRGASFRLLSLTGRSEGFRIHVSVPLVLEYEATALEQADALGLSTEDVAAVVDYLCAVAGHHEVFYLWRPVLRDPRDEMVLELAVAASCSTIVTFNKRDFEGAAAFGLRIETPREFLQRIGEIP